MQVVAKAHDDYQMHSHVHLEAAACKAWQQVITVLLAWLTNSSRGGLFAEAC